MACQAYSYNLDIASENRKLSLIQKQLNVLEAFYYPNIRTRIKIAHAMLL